jgi:membrane protease YdiL (CAAX protease family)
MFYKERFSPLSQLAVLLMLAGVCFIIGGIATVYIGSLALNMPFGKVLADPQLIIANASAARLSQFAGTFFMFALPVLVFAYIVDKKRPFGFIGFNITLSGKQVFYTVLIFMAALMVSGALGMLNSMIPIPLKMEQYVKGMEAEYMKETTAMITLSDTKGYIISMIMLALLPALFEEIFFRGCLQKIMITLTRNPFAGILITSILFSAIHMSYYGFLPRIFLGLTLGYLVYYSKNLWPAVLLHFLYNGFTVTMGFIGMQRGKTMQEALDADLTGKMAAYNTLFAGLIFTVAVIYLFKAYRRESELVLAAHQPPALPIDNSINNI